MNLETLRTTVEDRILRLNEHKHAAIFMVTGINSAGKTTFTRRLLSELPFYQSANLGVVSKMIRLLRPDIPVTELENFDGNEASRIFRDAQRLMIDSYFDTGVNTLFDGVQIDPVDFAQHPHVLGGVVLNVPERLLLERGNHPDTHFNRGLKRVPTANYQTDLEGKFAMIDNTGTKDETFIQILRHLDARTTEVLHQYE